jgi:hypothetical protein
MHTLPTHYLEDLPKEKEAAYTAECFLARLTVVQLALQWNEQLILPKSRVQFHVSSTESWPMASPLLSTKPTKKPIVPTVAKQMDNNGCAPLLEY